MGLPKRAPNRNALKARNSNISKRIDKKLDFVAETIAYAVGNRYVETESQLFAKTLTFQDFKYINFLDLKYNFENRFMAISYNLELESEIQTDERFKESGGCVFEAVTKGKYHTKDAQWICTQYDGDIIEKDRCLERLNNRFIIERVVSLDLQKIRVWHEKDSDKWHIRCESMIGSSTWVLIPPVVNLIKPTKDECVKFLEFFELVSDAVVNNT